MPLTHYSERHLVQLLATRSRRTDTTPWELSRSHVELGRFLAGELVEHLRLDPCEIRHPQGIRSGWQIAEEQDVTLLCFMRAGLYATEGVREIFQRAAVHHVHPVRNQGLPSEELALLTPAAGRTYVLIDSVVNTGSSLMPVLRQLRAEKAATVFVLALVTPVPTAQRLAEDFPDVHFLFARISENQYTGQGATDTGNRLFNTLSGKG
jgi:uracil phosphoribosyltransferase